MPAAQKPPMLGLQKPHLMRACQILNSTPTTLTEPELLVEVLRPAGALWINSTGPVVTLLLLTNDKRD